MGWLAQDWLFGEQLIFPKHQMGDIVERALKTLNYQYWITEQDLGFKQYRLSVAGQNGVIDCYISVVEHENFIRLTFPIHVSIPSYKRSEVLEFVSMINATNINGKFVHNVKRLIFSYTSVIPLEQNKQETQKIFSKGLKDGIELVEKYTHGIMLVAFGDALPQEEFYWINNLVDPSWN